ncbi:MAG: DNA repair protein RecN [Alphaproteobacteria bacterium]
MLRRLSIQDIVLADHLELAFHNGLGVLTGESGAGKSILLGALGLALGVRADARLVRHGAAQATVSAEFDIASDHPVRALLEDRGFDGGSGGDDPLILRRTLAADGKSRAFVNDVPVSAALLRELGEPLVEIQGQAENRGILNPACHRDLLDSYGKLDKPIAKVGECFEAWRKAAKAEQAAAAAQEKARHDEDHLRHALEELDALDPAPGEERALAEERAFLRNGARLAEALGDVHGDITAERGIDDVLNAARHRLDRESEIAGGRLDGARRALDAAAAELTEATQQLRAVMESLEADPGRLDAAEERLFALKALARKHHIEVDGLAELRRRIARQVQSLDNSGQDLERLARETTSARGAYVAAAEQLTPARKRAASALDKAIAGEIRHLKLKHAVFHTRLEPLDEADWGPRGTEKASFEISTVPGSPPGPLARIASGGEAARFMLALRVVLARVRTVPTLIFDEVDSGISGAVAAAVGDRLALLGSDLQVLVITHSPQVAARGAHHWRVLKREDGATMVTVIDELNANGRREEIARMLAGAKVTGEARAAASRLLGLSD